MKDIVTIIIAANVLITFWGFRSRQFFNRFSFAVGPILQSRQYERILISTFLHADYIHLLFNMISFYSFAAEMQQLIGGLNLLILYFGSALGGDLLALYIQRHHPAYRAVGASGAISGVIFSSVLFFPAGRIYLFFVPIGIPTWLFAILFVLISVYGIGKQAGNIGHEAHLGGALTGLLITGMLYPEVLADQIVLTLVLFIPVVVFLAIIIRKPELLHIQYEQKRNINGDPNKRDY